MKKGDGLGRERPAAEEGAAGPRVASCGAATAPRLLGHGAGVTRVPGSMARGSGRPQRGPRCPSQGRRACGTRRPGTFQGLSEGPVSPNWKQTEAALPPRVANKGISLADEPADKRGAPRARARAGA